MNVKVSEENLLRAGDANFYRGFVNRFGALLDDRSRNFGRLWLSSDWTRHHHPCTEYI